MSNQLWVSPTPHTFRLGFYEVERRFDGGATVRDFSDEGQGNIVFHLEASDVPNPVEACKRYVLGKLDAAKTPDELRDELQAERDKSAQLQRDFARLTLQMSNQQELYRNAVKADLVRCADDENKVVILLECRDNELSVKVPYASLLTWANHNDGSKWTRFNRERFLDVFQWLQNFNQPASE